MWQIAVVVVLRNFHMQFIVPVERNRMQRAASLPKSCRPAVSSSNVQTAQAIFGPGDEGEGWWDARNSASPVILPPSQHDQRWRMWYYGRAGTEWAMGTKAFLPTGRIGAAESRDGLKWHRIRGLLPEGACLDPPKDERSFDCVHVGVGDVVSLPNGTLWMYYFGGGLDEVMKGQPGIRMQIGMAASDDGGKSWTRLNGGHPILTPGEPGSFDALFVAWPRVLPPWDMEGVSGIPPGKWYMSYHTASFEGGLSWAAGAAFSDDGFTWTKAPGPVLAGSSDGLWDSKGVGVRSIASAPDGSLVMLYEAVDDAGDHAIGVAKSNDGVAWERCMIPGAQALGGPVLTKGSANCWDSRVIGTPYIVPPQTPGDNWRLYHIGESTVSPGLSIGLAESVGSDLTQWHKV